MKAIINIVTPVFPPYSSGMSNVAYAHSRLLQERGYGVSVFVPNYDGPQASHDIFEGVMVYRLKPVLRRGNAAFVPKLTQYLGSGIIHLHYPFFGGAEVVWLNKIFKRRPYILHYHMDVFGRGVSKLFFSFHKRIIFPLILSSALKIFVSSYDYARHSAVSRFFQKEPNKVLELPNGVDTKHFFPGRPDPFLTKKYGLKGLRVVLFVGALDRAHYFKGLWQLLESVKEISEAKLIVVGEGDMRFRYEQWVIDHHMSDRIIFTGKVSSEDLPKYYRLANVCVLPSVDSSEAFGMVLLEAMACKIPVVASNLPGVRSVVDDGVNGYLTRPKDISDLTKKIQKILDNKEVAKRMGIMGRKKVLHRYSWEKVGDMLEEIYDAVNNNQ